MVVICDPTRYQLDHGGALQYEILNSLRDYITSLSVNYRLAYLIYNYNITFLVNDYNLVFQASNYDIKFMTLK